MAVKRAERIFPFLALVVGVLTLLWAAFLSRSTPHPRVAELEQAARLMQTATAEIRSFRESIGQPVDVTLDPNQTGLIGPEYTDFTTTLGNLEAKRTSTNPVFAAMMARYFLDMGLRRGDVVAVGASGSFPGMALATLCAARVLELEPRVIYSLGASMYGAGSRDCTLLDMLSHLRSRGVLPYAVLAVSLGGDDDQAEGLIFPEARDGFLEKAANSGVPFINEPNLAASEQARLKIYGKGVRCFVNVGGASVNMGNRGFSMRLSNGLVRPENAAELAASSNGLAAHFLRQGVPVVHLLDMRHLALKHGIPIDAKPLPPVGQGAVYAQHPPKEARAAVLAVGLLLCVGLLAGGKKNLRKRFISRSGRRPAGGPHL